MQTESTMTTVQFDMQRAARALVVASVVVVALGVLREFAVSYIGTDTVLQDLRHFALDTERSIPAWYSSLLLTLCAGLLFIIAGRTRQAGHRDSARWSILALLFLVMAIDEVVSFHEVLIEPLRNRFGLTGIFYFAWVIPGTAAVLAIGTFYVPFLLRLPRAVAFAFVLSGAVYVGGALGLEFVGGSLAAAHGMESADYLAVAVLEEALEIAGLTLFVTALARYLAGELGQPARNKGPLPDTGR